MIDQKQRVYFNQVDHRYPHRNAVAPPYAQELELEHIFTTLHPKTGDKILDFGAGSGRVSLYFLKKGFDVLAWDISEQSLNDLKVLYLKNKTTSWGTLTITTTKPKTPVDAIVGADILHHVSMQDYVPLFFHLLAPGGKIVFSEPNAWHLLWYLHYFAQHIPWEIEKGIVACTRKNLMRVCNTSGFRNVSIHEHGFLPTTPLQRFPLLCRWNAFTLARFPLLSLFAFRFIVSAQKL